MASKRPPNVITPGRGKGRSVPRGYVVGRTSAGRGPPELIPITDFTTLGQVTASIGPKGGAGGSGGGGGGGTDINSNILSLVSTPGAIPNGTGGGNPPGLVGQETDEGDNPWIIPGPPGQAGATGATGATGAPGVGFPGLDGADGDDAWPIPGPAGTAGKQGQLGPPGLDGADGDDAWPIPGPAGTAGKQGAPGFALDGLDGEDFSIMPAGLSLPLSGGIMQGTVVCTQPFTFIGTGSATAPQLSFTSQTGVWGNSTSVAFTVAGLTVVQATAGSFGLYGAAKCLFAARDGAATNASNTDIFQFQAYATNATGTQLVWTELRSHIATATAGSEVGELRVLTYHGGAETLDFAFGNGGLYAVSISGQQLLSTAGGIVGIQASPYSQQTPLTGFTITVGNGINFLILTPAGTLAAGTVTMPAAPIDGQEVTVSSTQIITALTVQANSGQTIDGGISAATFAANSFAKWKYVLGTTTWYRVG